MLICHRLSSKCINVLHCDTDAIVPPVDIFTSNFRVLTLKNKPGQKDKERKDGREGGREGGRKKGREKKEKNQQ